MLELVEDGSKDNDDAVEEVISASEKNQSDEQVSCLERISPKQKRKGAVSRFFSDLSEAKLNRHETFNKLDLIKSELHHYKHEKVADLDDDPLKWWLSNHTHYPLMSQLVRKYWSLPATSVRSEEVFSVAGGILTKRKIGYFMRILID